MNWSGRRDLNPRSPGPQPGALNQAWPRPGVCSASIVQRHHDGHALSVRRGTRNSLYLRRLIDESPSTTLIGMT